MASTDLSTDSAGIFERVVALVAAWRLPNAFALAETLRTLWNPLTCPESELPILAWAFSVDYWRDDWPLSRKRAVIAESRLYHSLKTTVAGTRMALGYRDAKLVRAHLPRHGFFCDSSVSATEQREWRKALPEIRIYDAPPFIIPRRPGRFVGISLFARSDARLARVATLMRNGIETPLRIIPLGDPSTPGERIILPVQKQAAMIVGRGGSRTVAPSDVGVNTLAVRLGTADSFTRETATPGERGALIQTRRQQIEGARAHFTPEGRGGRRFVAPSVIAFGFTSLKFSDQPGKLASRGPSNVVGKSRVMRSAYTANFLVDWSREVPMTKLPRGRKVAAPSEPVVREIMEAIVDAQAMRDRNTLSLRATRRLTYADVRALEGGTRYGERRGN
ncbi:phage tail protein I [Methylobacterium sp. WCS2018Hpa-22]|uniref:phage tail protein I n=1 Tax=Methylobacterium sp. WCS2018Hpa-22 TaxID=3073633 RepID=UPI0038620C55